MIPLLAFLAAISGDLRPDAPPPDVTLRFKCFDSGLLADSCIVPKELLQDFAEMHNEHVEEIRRLRSDLEKLRVIKGCAKLEVVPFKKDRDL